MSLFALQSPGFVAYLLLLALLLGLVMGSFLNCLAYRMARGGTALRGRSVCPSCGHTLRARELIPLFSWFLQKGRCRVCAAPISRRYPLVELLTGLCFVALLLYFGLSLQTLQLWIFVVILLTLSLVDLDTGYLPDSLLLAAVINFLIFLPTQQAPIETALRAVGAGLALAIPLLLLSLVMDRVLKRESMGGGDIKLFFVVGLYLGFPNTIFVVIQACILGIAFPLLCKVRTQDGEGAFPFGPAIAASTFLSLFLAEPAVFWYLSLF